VYNSSAMEAALQVEKMDPGFLGAANVRDTPTQPWICSPYSLISWWDMEQFSAAGFYSIGCQLSVMIENSDRDRRGGIQFSITPEQRETFRAALTRIETDCKDLGLKVSFRASQEAIRQLEQAKYFGNVGSAVEHFRNTIEWEMSEFLFFHMPPKQAEFYDQKELFGSLVNRKFPAIQFDMVEAGNCFAMGRGTACVFHLMRIMETGVQAFGTKLGVTFADQKNWQPILDEINKAIKALPPKDPATVEMSAAAANLYCVKLAWRNEVMHPNDTYTLEEAENLIRLVQVFMKHLATIV
jgi:hypothetical protein